MNGERINVAEKLEAARGQVLREETTAFKRRHGEGKNGAAFDVAKGCRTRLYRA